MSRHSLNSVVEWNNKLLCSDSTLWLNAHIHITEPPPHLVWGGEGALLGTPTVVDGSVAKTSLAIAASRQTSDAVVSCSSSNSTTVANSATSAATVEVIIRVNCEYQPVPCVLISKLIKLWK